MPRLENWGVVVNGDKYTAPECRSVSLQGNIYGHHAFEDGDWVVTSSLLEIDATKKIAKTKNSIYVLGDLHSEFNDFLKENNYTIAQYILKAT